MVKWDIQEVDRKHFGVTTVHSMRHTFALAVTQRSIKHELLSPGNPYSGQLGTLCSLADLGNEEMP